MNLIPFSTLNTFTTYQPKEFIEQKGKKLIIPFFYKGEPQHINRNDMYFLEKEDCCKENYKLFPNLQLAQDQNILLDVKTNTLKNICKIPTTLKFNDCIGYWVQFDGFKYSWPENGDLLMIDTKDETKRQIEIPPNSSIVVSITPKKDQIIKLDEIGIVADIKKLPIGLEILETLIDESWLACLSNKTTHIVYLNNKQVIGMIQKRNVKHIL